VYSHLALLLAAAVLAGPATAADGDPAAAPAALDYTDPSELFSLRLPGKWDRWEPEMVASIVGQTQWPETTAIFSMALDPEHYTCPCLWVARFENDSPGVNFRREIQRGTYGAAPLERLTAGPDRPTAWTQDPSQFFFDAERYLVWGWGEQTDAEGEPQRVLTVYAPSTTATAALMFVATPNMFDFYVPKFVAVADTLSVQGLPTEAERAAAAEPGSVARRGSTLLAATAAGFLALVVAAGVSGARRGGAGFAVKCACLAVLSSTVFLGNFVVAFNDGEGWVHSMRVGHAFSYALAGVCLVPGIFVGVTRWRRGANSGRLTRAWIWGSLLALVLVIQELAKNIKS
jgi:hypothetical protein